MDSIKRSVDILMTIVMMCLMAYGVTGEVAHEFIGVLMTILVIVHQILNRRWHSAIFKGKYNYFRIFSTIIDILLLISFVLTAISGIAMSNQVVPFLYSIINVNTARIMHLAFSHWSFILMGLHIGCHIGIMNFHMPKNVKFFLRIIATLIGGFGFYILLKSDILNYIIFKTHFAFIDYEKNFILVFFENISMLTFFVIIGNSISNILKNITNRNYNK